MHGEELESRLAAWIAGDTSEDFGEMMLAVHGFQRAANPAYDRYCALFPPAQDWREIPALPQRTFKEAAIRSFPAYETTRTFRTSGTTGEGYGEHHFRTLRLYEAAARSGWALAGCSGRQVLSLVAAATEAPFSSLSQMASWLCEGDSAFFVRSGRSQWKELVKNLAETEKPVVLFGTALAFLDWFESLGTAAISLPEGSLAVETGGYKGTARTLSKQELYTRFERHLGLPAPSIINEYGMTELSSQFYARGVDTLHHAPPWARGLVIDPATGREVPEGGAGVLRLFDAANLWSVAAIQTQDLAVRRGDAFVLFGRDPAALPRGCSRAADEMLRSQR